MSLSNWDTLAFDQSGKSTDGIFTHGEVKVEIYKNWLYLHDSKGWKSGQAFMKDTIAQISSCDMDYKGIHITAKRGRQYGIYCVVYNVLHDKDYNTTGINFMAGCGVDGYKNHNWVGVEKESYTFLKSLIKKVIDDDIPESASTLIKIPDNPLRFNQGDAFFANYLSKDVPATECNNADEPVAMKLINNLKGEN
jgi:hypothetical protein